MLRIGFLGLAETPGSANRCLPILSGIMRTAEDLGYIEEGSNPARGIRRYKTKPKERFLTNERNGAVGRGAGKGKPALARCRRHFIRLFGSHRCRKGELLSLKWDYYIDSNLYLPDSKTGPKTVFLSTPARKLLTELSKCNNSQWVFALKKTSNRTREYLTLSGTGSEPRLESVMCVYMICATTTRA